MEVLTRHLEMAKRNRGGRQRGGRKRRKRRKELT
jgi:hypothetical protein